MHINMDEMGFAAAALGILSIFVSLFWMVVGWRAMVAHERLASATERLAGPERSSS